MTTRQEHLEWCKQRAFAEIDFTKDPKQAIISMMSDLRKHPETNQDSLRMLCIYMLSIPLSRQQVVDFVNEFQ